MASAFDEALGRVGAFQQALTINSPNSKNECPPGLS
jgi:hypothetical protein